MRYVSAIGLAIGLTVTVAGNAGAADNAKVWEGFLKITGQIGCTGVQGATGTHVSIYRPALGAGATMLSIVYLRAAISMVNTSEGSAAQMNGAGTYKGQMIGSKARLFNYNSSYDFTVTPATVVATTPIVGIVGTIDNFLNNAGCTVTIAAKYHLQP